MGEWQHELGEIVRLNDAVRPAEAEERFKRLVEQCTGADLQSLDADIQAALASFLPKRRKALTTALALRRITTMSHAEAPGPTAPGVPAAAPAVPGPRGAAGEGVRPSPRPGPPGALRANLVARSHAVPPVVALPAPTPDPPGTPAAADGLPDADFDARLAAISQLLSEVKPNQAEEAFRTLVTELGDDELRKRSSALLDGLDDFLPKRRRALREFLDEGLTRIGFPEAVVPDAAAAEQPVRTPPRSYQPGSSAYMSGRFTDALDDLSKSHIFQWATFYRDVLSEYFDGFIVELVEDDRTTVLNIAKGALMHHARDIFGKGYVHLTNTQGFAERNALAKSLSGLQRFLDLPLELYSSRLADAHRNRSAWSLRRLCSAMLFGILHGYSDTQLSQAGRKILPRFPRSWAYVLPFLTAGDLHELSLVIEPGQFIDGIGGSVLPLVEVLDKFLRNDPSSGPLPALSQYVEASRRLDVSLRLAPNASDARPVDVQCYLLADYVERHHIEEASSRAVSVVIAPLRPDMRGTVAAVERLADIVVPTSGLTSDVSPAKQLTSMLERIIWAQAEGAKLDRPINYNFALAFPIENPFLTLTYNHVYRHSVRNLMNSFERRNGVRLWCSVRRSGKTTACASDLGSTTGTSAVIPQTCDDTGQMADGGVFYGRIQQALDRGQRLPDGFVIQAVTDCLSGQTTNAARFVLVLDEYETLFGQLTASLVSRPELRYLVVQPLLNQLVEFTRDNLLVFMGQQPNAHFILLDQNQLSPVVEQDSFPLFTHDPAAAMSGEFYELVHKVMSSHVDLEPEFVTMVYRETGGHPFLTVKLLVAFMDWLIESRYSVSNLSPVSAELFATFARESLTGNKIAFSSYYDFFKAAAEDHLSATGRRQNPWLHSVYSILRALRLDAPTTLSCTEDQYNELAAREQIRSPTQLLATARAANFLAIDGGMVRPRIPLLARIAAAVTPS